MPYLFNDDKSKIQLGDAFVIKSFTLASGISFSAGEVKTVSHTWTDAEKAEFTPIAVARIPRITTGKVALAQFGITSDSVSVTAINTENTATANGSISIHVLCIKK